MSKLTIDDCQRIYDAAIAATACEGQAQAAKRALDAGDVEAFERVCRASARWLRDNGIEYALTDGMRETWHANGALWYRASYANGKLHGLYEAWHDNGALRYRANYANGKLHGLCEAWHDNGTLRYRASYANGKLHGLYESWHDNGALESRANYANGALRHRWSYENGVLISDLTNEVVTP